ncbi:unnamed protein product [Oppiella nova]|uniref:Uncharacterized protein n=1 Tax=Oppiella nova TaxID=334625 RepID=A0A7R9M5J2_9ACAR|nr:unnamed protein product [Oppiella nova]CAG2171179.1 unnamed protein product [Oppiella nova]
MALNTKDFPVDDYLAVKNSRNFTGKVVLVTGSSSGIGEGIVKLFSVLGAKVVVTGRKEAEIHKVAQEVQELSPQKLKPLEVSADLTKREDVERLINETIKTFGQLDVLVNNAGPYFNGDIHDKNITEEFDLIFNIDLRAVVQTIHIALPYLEKTNGTIIDISAILGLAPSALPMNYCMVKAAINMLTEVLALELGPKGVRVNTVSPAATEGPGVTKTMIDAITKLAPLRRIGEPLDIAKAVVFLASTDAQYITAVRNSRDFSGKVVLVTGSSWGIGEGIVKLFSVLGANVVVTGRKVTEIHRVAQEIQQLSPQKLKPLEVSADLTKREDVERLINETIKTFGQLDVLVNNAGPYVNGNIHDQNIIDQFDQVFNMDVRGVMQTIQTALPHIEKSKGVIINISAILGLAPSTLPLNYCMAKAALNMMTEVLALELGPKGVRVNTVSPAATEGPGVTTEMVNTITKTSPLRRVGQPLDIAKAVVFLASTDAQYITGENVVVDGGQRYFGPPL